MQAHERLRLMAIADKASRAIYDSLNEALTQARNNLFDARLRGNIGGPDLIRRREEELEEAKQRLRTWAAANPSTAYGRRFAREREQRHISNLAAQIGAAAEAAVRNR